MKKINKKYSTAIAQGMYVLSVAMFIIIAMLFGSCSTQTAVLKAEREQCQFTITSSAGASVNANKYKSL